ncbi:MAG: hypothetical protein R3B07_15545 [Polyangiaceae bacterium]
MVAPGCEWCAGQEHDCVSKSARRPCSGLKLTALPHCINDPGDPAAHDRKLIEDRLGVTLGAMTPDAPPIVGQLENFSGVVHAVQRGRCYFMVATLAPDAKPGKAMTHFSWRTKTESEGSVGGAATAGAMLGSGRFCPLSEGTLRFYFGDLTGPPLQSNGTGGVVVQVFSEPIDAAELSAMEQRRADLLRKIDEMPADCDGYSYDCGNDRDHCERDCWMSYRVGDNERKRCERTCEQLERDCLRRFQRRCGY